MNKQRLAASLCVSVIAFGAVAGCGGPGGKEGSKPGEAEGKDAVDTTPLALTIAMPQVGEIPKKDNEIQTAMEKYTNTKLDIQWIPSAAYEDKKNIMIASSELPKLLFVKTNATTTSAIKNDLFWEIGPLLKNYPNLSAQSKQYYDNISVDGKLYGVPTYRDIGRAGVIYRKDWFDALGLKPPKTYDDWYEVLKAIAQNDPDKNGQADTYGWVLDKNVVGSSSSGFMTRFAVSQGAPNKWGEASGKLQPEFMFKEYVDALKFVRKVYAEKLINQDFAVIQGTDADNKWDAGKTGVQITVASNAAGRQDKVVKSSPGAVTDVMPLEGPGGVRVPGEPGNNGFYVFPKSSVKTEAELKRILTFLDKLLDEPMSTLLTRGIEGKHFAKEGDKAVFKDLTAFQAEVKPYRDNFPSFEIGGKGLPLKNTPLAEKAWKIIADNLKAAVPNPALTLSSATYTDKGAELDTMIADAQIKYIMGKIDDAGWQAEVDKWRKAGGDKLIDEFTAEYAKLKAKK